jgi:uncharacterized membrane protein YfcA
VIAGLAAGVLSGLFGVGGGFVIVPALVLVTGMGIHRVIATSLLVIALVGASGVTSHVLPDRPLPMALTGLFVVGEIAGMELGSLLTRRLKGVGLSRGGRHLATLHERHPDMSGRPPAFRHP